MPPLFFASPLIPEHNISGLIETIIFEVAVLGIDRKYQLRYN